MKGKKISQLVALHTLLSACAGISLAIILTIGFFQLETDQQTINNDKVVLNDVLRMEETYRQWLIMMDLVLGNNQTYLTLGTQRQAHFFIDIIQLIAKRTLAKKVKTHLQTVIDLIKIRVITLEELIQGEKVAANTIIEFDRDSMMILELLKTIKHSIHQQAQQNVDKAKKQRTQVIIQSLFSSVIFIVVIVMLWFFLTIYLVKPIQKLNNAVNLARKNNQTFNYTPKIGTIETQELAENARIFINNLEEEINNRTQLYKIERDKAILAAEAKTKFLSLMNHELRTPLNAIMGFSELLATDPLTEKQQRYQKQSIKASTRLLKLLHRIFELIDIENTDFSFPLEKIKIHSCLAVALKQVKEESQEKEIHLKKIIQRENMVILGHSRRLSDVFYYIIQNAIKYSTRKGQIQIDCHQDKQTLVFVVTDHGIGIPKTVEKSIFVPFVDRQKNFVDGLGISLYISKRFIELMKGEISFSSEEGQGSRFYVRLPIASIT